MMQSTRIVWMISRDLNIKATVGAHSAVAIWDIGGVLKIPFSSRLFFPQDEACSYPLP